MSSYLKPLCDPKKALSAPENHVKSANRIAPRGGKQSVRLYAVRPACSGRCPGPPFPRHQHAGELKPERARGPAFAPCAIITPPARVDNGRGRKTRCRPRVAPEWRTGISQVTTPANRAKRRNEGNYSRSNF